MSHSKKPVTVVQIEGLVVLKMVKHCEEEVSSSGDIAQGVLLGLVDEGRLEVTNCFPYPRFADGKEPEDQYQTQMMINLRRMHVDHMHVGWYQGSSVAAFVNNNFLDSQYQYQNVIPEAIVLVYDPMRTSHGKLSLQAYRLTDRMLEFYKEGDFSIELMRKAFVHFESMMEELPVVIRNSHFINSLFCEIEHVSGGPQRYPELDLGYGTMLEKSMQQLMARVDDMCHESSKLTQYLWEYQKLQTNKFYELQKRQVENNKRREQGEAILPEDDIHRRFRSKPPPPRVDALLVSAQIEEHCRHIQGFSAHTLSKLLVSNALRSVTADSTDAPLH